MSGGMNSLRFLLSAAVASVAFGVYLDRGDEVVGALALFNTLFAVHWSRRAVTE